MLNVTNLTKKYDNLIAVNELNLQINNELFVFLGPNGAGKTTTIKMMTGLIKPSSGTVTLNGFDIQQNSMDAKRILGLVPDTPNLYEKLSAREYLDFIGKLYRVDQRVFDKRFEQLIELFSLNDRVDDLIQSFSHGMKQKCVLAGALIHEPEILFLDEPTVGLDPKSAKILKDLLRGLVKKGTTVFMSTHILEIAEVMCDRVGIIKNGQLIALGTMDELRKTSAQKEQSLEDIFLELTGDQDSSDVINYLEGN